MNLNSNIERNRELGLQVFKMLEGKFKFEPWNQKFYTKVAAYFAGEEIALKHEMDPKKGLAILGPVGTGKTSLLTCLKEYQLLQFACKTMPELRNIYQEDGYQGIKVYTEGIRKQGQAFRKVGNLFIDDLGAERFTTRYHEQFDLFKDLIQARYNLFTTHQSKPLLHFTSNCTLDELIERYDERGKSRIIGLCNILYLPGDAPDMRILLHKEKMANR